MDGTLLDENGELPPGFFELLHKMEQKNVKFIVASGRSYPVLKEQFADAADKLTFICDNGAYIVDNSEISFISVLDKECVKESIDICEQLGIKVLLCGRRGTYMTKLNSAQAKEILLYYITPIYVEDLYSVDDDIFKIAVLDLNGIENGSSDKLIKRFSDNYTAQVSGEYWLDIMNKGINKGTALKKIMQKSGVKKEEVMAFGDYLNDIELLNASGIGYAVQNAHSDVIKAARHIAPPNTEYGVITEIKKQLGL